MKRVSVPAARQNPEDREEFNLFVLTSTGLQKWQLGLDDTDKFFYEADVTNLAREAVWSVWPGNTGEGAEGASAILRLWLMVVAATKRIFLIMSVFLMSSFHSC